MFFIPIIILVLGGLVGWYFWRRNTAQMPRSFGKISYEVEKRELSIPSGDHVVKGYLYLPKGKEGKLPTLIACHGYGASYQTTERLVGMPLAMSGIAVFCFDFFGGNRHSISGGTMMDMSIFTERDDLLSVFDFIRSYETTDQDNLFLLGESQGAVIVGITAPLIEDKVRAVVEYYPAYCLVTDAQARYKTEADIPNEVKLIGNTISKDYFVPLLGFDVYKEIAPFQKPVLIVHGTWDSLVPLSVGKRTKETYKNATMKTIFADVHGFTRYGKVRSAKYTYDFIQKLKV